LIIVASATLSPILGNNSLYLAIDNNYLSVQN
jgi:hypothetical protein